MTYILLAYTSAAGGPFAQSKEVLASFAIADCASYDRAVRIGARITDATGDTVEVRPAGQCPEPPGL